MRFALRGIGLMFAVLVAALTPIFALTKILTGLAFGQTGDRQSIVLRKIKSVRGAGAFFRRNESPLTGGGMGLAGSLALVGFVLCLGLTAVGAGLLIATIQSRELHAGVLLANGAAAVRLKDIEGRIAALQTKVTKAFELAGPEIDFTKPDALKELGAVDSKDAVAKLKEINSELTEKAKDREDLAFQLGMKDRAHKFATDPVNNPPHPTGSQDDLANQRKRRTLGQVFVESKAYKAFKNGERNNLVSEEDAELKTLMTTSAGFAPESTRVPGLVIDAVTRPLQLIDVIPSGPTDMAAIVYMEETTRTHNAAERTEGAAYAEDAFVFTQRSETVRSIGTSLPVTNEQLEDVAGIGTYIDNRLIFSVRQRADREILLGDGTPPNMTGIKNKASIQTQAKGTDPASDAFFKAMTKVRVTGRAIPNLDIVHPTDWQNIRLTRTADGLYIWGNPAEAGPERMWGLQVVQCDADSAGTGYVLDTLFTQMYIKKGVTVEIGFVGSNFTEGKKTIRAGFRGTMVIYRAAAICSVTGL